jgi:ubiquinone/menaquinone biosynthesis C-methylase UbiE
MTEYVLGTSDHELERLELQSAVWRGPTEDFLAALEIAPGASALDLGCGPGHVVESLRRLVGPAGIVTGVDESPRWIATLESTIRDRGWTNVRARRGRLQEVEFAPGSQDLVFLRWVLSFLPDPAGLLARFARWLRPGGTLAVLDYNHEGISLYPESEGFRAIVRATRSLYASRGGDTFVMGHIGRLFAEAGLEPAVLRPYVLAGAPDSPAFHWADAFFPFHSAGMVHAGALSPGERAQFLEEWEARKRDPGALFFSPIVVGAAARTTGRPKMPPSGVPGSTSR